MVKRMVVGAFIGFLIGKLVVSVIPESKVLDKLFGANENFFMVICIILVFIILFSIVPSIGKGSE